MQYVNANKNTVNKKYMELLKDCHINFVVRGADYATETGKQLVALYNQYNIGCFIEDISGW